MAIIVASQREHNIICTYLLKLRRSRGTTATATTFFPIIIAMLLLADDDAMSRRLTATITTVVIRFHFEKNGSEKHSSRIRSILLLLYECVWKNLMAFVFPFSCFPHVIKFPWVHSIKKTAGVSHRQRECNNQICFRTSKFVLQTKHRPCSQM